MDTKIENMNKAEVAQAVFVRGRLEEDLLSPAFLTSANGRIAVNGFGISRWEIPNSAIRNLGAVNTGVYGFCVVPPRVLIKDIFVKTVTPATGLTNLTMKMGVIGPNYDDLFAPTDITVPALWGGSNDDYGSTMSSHPHGVVSDWDLDEILFLRFDTTDIGGLLGNVSGFSAEIYLTTGLLP